LYCSFLFDAPCTHVVDINFVRRQSLAAGASARIASGAN